MTSSRVQRVRRTLDKFRDNRSKRNRKGCNIPRPLFVGRGASSFGKSGEWCSSDKAGFYCRGNTGLERSLVRPRLFLRFLIMGIRVPVVCLE